MSKTEMLMPKMGESIMEGTVLKWLKKEGDKINEDESVLEVATDKVDTEIPSTCSGTLKKIIAKEGEIVKVGSPIAIIDSDSQIQSNENKDFVGELENNFEEIKDFTYKNSEPEMVKLKNDSNKFYSPLVLNIANRENISLDVLDSIKGSGENERVTKLDLLKYLEDKNLEINPIIEEDREIELKIELKEGEEIIEPDRVRKIIASRMIESKKISPHVTSFVESDITNVFNSRNKIKKKFLEENNMPLTFNPVFIKCVADALTEFPMMNISYINNKIIKKNYINIGIAVALKDDNLIVPVIKNVDKMDFMKIVKESNKLINRTRNGELNADDLEGGTYTISNVGSFGNVMGTPIIMQPQVGILAIGTIKKVPAVIETKNGDEIQIRNKLFLSHTYDHRIVDGALGGKFAQKVAENLENFDLKSNIS
ncbi:MAG: 2-oxoglutarate dehydrogenase [Marinoscillum sp.]|nr:2-oxoglutarate dehydrogenase [Marinoscillum sp.]OUX26871.1 MAG: 2-oxoglutarate dehydrogenase [Flammeovirgaceae bacterium TMED262]